MGVGQDIFQVGHNHLIGLLVSILDFHTFQPPYGTNISSSGTLNRLMHLLLRPLLTLDRYSRFLSVLFDGRSSFLLRRNLFFSLLVLA